MRRTLTQNPIHTIDKVRVNLGVRSYDILIGQGLLANIPSLFANVAQSTSFFVVCDEHVQEDAALVAKGFKNQNINATIAVLPSGENQKCLDSAAKLFDQLVNIHAGKYRRESTIIPSKEKPIIRKSLW